MIIDPSIHPNTFESFLLILTKKMKSKLHLGVKEFIDNQQYLNIFRKLWKQSIL